MESYDPGTNSWATVPFLNVGRESAGVAAIGSMLYVVGGHIPGGDPSGRVEILDTSSASGWTTLPQADWMPTARAGFALVTDGAYLYAIGGNTQANNSGPVATVERFDPSAPSGSRWSTLAPMPAAGNASGAGVLTGTIIVVGSDGTSPDRRVRHRHGRVAQRRANAGAAWSHGGRRGQRQALGGRRHDQWFAGLRHVGLLPFDEYTAGRLVGCWVDADGTMGARRCGRR